MAHIADDFIGLRVPEDLKRLWMQQAEADGRSLSNWIIRQLEKVEPIKAERPAQGASPRRRRVA